MNLFLNRKKKLIVTEQQWRAYKIFMESDSTVLFRKSSRKGYYIMCGLQTSKETYNNIVGVFHTKARNVRFFLNKIAIR